MRLTHSTQKPIRLSKNLNKKLNKIWNHNPDYEISKTKNRPPVFANCRIASVKPKILEVSNLKLWLTLEPVLRLIVPVLTGLALVLVLK